MKMADLTQPADLIEPGAALAAVRRAGRAAHERVDVAFSGFDLGNPASYAAFLDTHAAIVLPLERMLAERVLPPWTPRAECLRGDLSALGRPVPPPLTIAASGAGAAYDGWCHGALYVLEGSRLGGRVLAGRVPDGLPHAYLSAAHGPGGCAKYGAAGAVGGHMVGKGHAVAGASAGCATGMVRRHEARKKAAATQKAQDQANQDSTQSMSGNNKPQQ